MFDDVYILFHFNIILKHNGISSTKINNEGLFISNCIILLFIIFTIVISLVFSLFLLNVLIIYHPFCVLEVLFSTQEPGGICPKVTSITVRELCSIYVNKNFLNCRHIYLFRSIMSSDVACSAHFILLNLITVEYGEGDLSDDFLKIYCTSSVLSSIFVLCFNFCVNKIFFLRSFKI